MKNSKATKKTGIKNQPSKPKLNSATVSDDKMVHVYFKVHGVTCPLVKGHISKLKAFNLRENILKMCNNLNVELNGNIFFAQ